MGAPEVDASSGQADEFAGVKWLDDSGGGWHLLGGWFDVTICCS